MKRQTSTTKLPSESSRIVKMQSSAKSPSNRRLGALRLKMTKQCAWAP
jgi:hypothetical protein